MSHLTSKLTGWALAAAGAVAAIAVAAVVLLSGGSPATGTATAAAMPTATVASASTVINAHASKLGKILVASNGDILYAFSKDSKNKDACAKISGCLDVWPIEAVHGKLKAGTGVKQSLLGTITVGGKKQATYDGHPLYGYVEANTASDTDYVGITQSGGTWPAVSPSGKLIK
jgi:predicted lipoprotein with Yx(FWY)xxD motif